MSATASVGARPANLVVINPSGNRSRVAVPEFPFTIGRQPENRLVLRDNRISRMHARITQENNEYVLEDLDSRHGLFVNGLRVQRHTLHHSDRIEFGFADSYKLIFMLEEDEIQRLLEQLAPSPKSAAPGAGNLAKLRALVEVARTLQNSLSTDDVLSAVVDAALTITGSERGFLLLRDPDQNTELEIQVARDAYGSPLPKSDLRVSTSVIQRALTQRRELLSMNFDPAELEGVRPEMSIVDLELRSVVCVPLVRVRAGRTQETGILSAMSDTVGVLYLDSRLNAADLSSGNRELLQTLALEASTILENARLLEQERGKQRLEEELNIAREIQTSLLPRRLPSTGWFQAAGSSLPSHQVGGDYFDVRAVSSTRWITVVADVSGKGVSSALLASLLQGAFLFASSAQVAIDEVMQRVNEFLIERTEGEKYATLFYCSVDADGLLQWANAGHVKPILVRTDGTLQLLGTTGMPVGMLETATYRVEQVRLQPGEKVVAFTDGVSEAQDVEGRFFDAHGLREAIMVNAMGSCAQLHDVLMQRINEFTDGVEQADDITLVVIEYRP